MCFTKCAALAVEQLVELSLPPAVCLNWLNSVSTTLPESRKGLIKCSGNSSRKLFTKAWKL